MQVPERADYIVLGGGLSGLSFAHDVARAGHSVLVLERDGVLGGLARTFEHKGYRFDYCAHRFHTADPRLLAHVRELVGDRFVQHRQLSRVFMDGHWLKYPYELQNFLRALPPRQAAATAADFLAAYVKFRSRRALGCPRRTFSSYEDWFVHFFGRRLYETMTRPYTTKIWKRDPRSISADWANERFQGVKLSKLVAIVVKKALSGSFSQMSLDDESLVPDGGAFWYGVGGAQDIPDAFAERLAQLGAHVHTRAAVQRIEQASRTVHFAIDGRSHHCSASHRVVSTIPLHSLKALLDEPVDVSAEELAALRYMDIVFVYLMLNRDRVSRDHWLYFADPEILFNRSVEFRNWSDRMCPPGRTSLCLDITCYADDEIWSMSDEQLVQRCVDDAVDRAGLFRRAELEDSLVVRVRDAYPLYDLGYRARLRRVVQGLEASGAVVCLGRTGVFKYNNSDGAIAMGMDLARRLLADPGAGPEAPSMVDFRQEAISY